MSGSDESSDGASPQLDDYGVFRGSGQDHRGAVARGAGRQPGSADQEGFDPPEGGVRQFGTRPSGRSNRGLIMVLLGGGVVVAGLIAAIAVKVSGGSGYVMSTPSTAGGYVLVSPRGSVHGDDRADARALGIKPNATVSATYKDPASSSSPPAEVSFLGVTGEVGDPYTFLHHNRLAAADPSTSVVDTDAGGAGKAVCVTVTGGMTITSCMWATGHSFGMITPTTAMSVDQVAGVMRRMRPDLEHHR